MENLDRIFTKVFIGDVISNMRLVVTTNDSVTLYCQFVNKDTEIPVSNQKWVVVKDFDTDRGYAVFDTLCLLELMFNMAMDSKSISETNIDQDTKFINDNITITKKVKKSRYVNFVRHIRPTNADPKDWLFGKIDPLRGVTLAFRLDYQDYYVSVGYATCNGENYSKKEGRDRANTMLNNNPLIFKMPGNMISDDGVTQDFIRSEAFNNLPYQTRKQIKQAIYND